MSFGGALAETLGVGATAWALALWEPLGATGALSIALAVVAVGVDTTGGGAAVGGATAAAATLAVAVACSGAASERAGSPTSCNPIASVADAPIKTPTAPRTATRCELGSVTLPVVSETAADVVRVVAAGGTKRGTVGPSESG
ncbi:MAG: hypothetical protein JNK04_17265, partial [Myxococcales bacterium]|nr:hypothetical protein [Myxococcales bacterium]